MSKKSKKIATPVVVAPVAPTPEAPAAKKEAWNKGKKVTQHAVEVGGQVFESMRKAFDSFGWNPKTESGETNWGPCVTFRAKLKALGIGGKLDYAPEGQKPKTFVLRQKGYVIPAPAKK